MRAFFKRTAALIGAAAIMAACPISAAAVSLKTVNGVKYIQYDSGESKVYTGWTTKAGKRYYYKNGIMKRYCWLKYGGERRYFLGKDGAMAVGKVTIAGMEYEFDESGRLMHEEWGLTLTAQDVTPTGMKLEFLWDGTKPSGELLFGLHYTIEQYKDGQWSEVPYKDGVGDICFEDLGYYINENEPVYQDKSWEYIYGELGAGKYRLCTPVLDFRGTANYDEKMYYAYFSL